MKYHQSTQEKNGDIITVLSKVEDAYIYNIPFPPSSDDISIFEDDNQVCVNIYEIDKKDNEIIIQRLGNIKYVKEHILIYY